MSAWNNMEAFVIALHSVVGHANCTCMSFGTMHALDFHFQYDMVCLLVWVE